MRDLLLWSTCYLCNQCLIPTVFKQIAHVMSSLRAFCIVKDIHDCFNEWNNGMSYSITNYSYPNDKIPWRIGAQPFGFRADVLVRTGKCIYCKFNCFILCVFYTVDFFDIFCIHCDQMAQEVLVLGIVKVRYFFICVRGSVFPLLICQSDCTVCFGSCINPVPSYLVDQRQYGREWSCFIFQV